MRLKHAAVPAAALALSFGALTAPAQAATEHCDSGLYPNKVEVDAGPKVQTDLAPGTEVCIKAGNETDIVYVNDWGKIKNTEILNRNGKAKGISYYAYGDVCVEDPYTYEDECDEGGGPVS
jgi:hypothetical protein